MEREKLAELVENAQKGDPDALNTLFNEFYNDVYYFALKTVKDQETACDVTQEAFVEIINTIGNLKEPAAFVTWIKQITYHQCTRYFKKKKDVLVSEDEEGNTVFDTLVEENGEFIPDEALDKKDFKETILKILDELSEEQRSAVILYYFDELSVKQIAEIQGVSEGTVKSRLNYARKSIKSSVEDYEKKTGIKLHSFALLPLIKWLLDGAFENVMPAASVEVVAESVTAATGAAVSVSATATATTAATATTTAATATTTTAVGIGAKIAALPVVTKVVAGVIATAVVATSTAGAVILSNKGPEDKPAGTVSTITTSDITSSENTSSTPSLEDENGELVLNGIIPEGCTYTCADGSVLTAGMPFPKSCTAGDKLQYGDYLYGYECVYGRDDEGNAQWYSFSEIFDMGDSGLIESDVFGAWTPAVSDHTKTAYGKIAKEINGKPIKALYATFWMCKNLETAPEIPSSITAMTATFYGCEKLKTAPVIPSNVERIMLTFSDCVALEGDVVLDVKLDKSLRWYYSETFNNTKNKINLKGKVPEADLILIAQNSNNRNVTVNGKRVHYAVVENESAEQKRVQTLCKEFASQETMIDAYANTFSFLPPSQFASKSELTEKDAFIFTYAYLIKNFTYPTQTTDEIWEEHTIPISDMQLFSEKVFGEKYNFENISGNLIEDEDSTASFSISVARDPANQTLTIKREKHAIYTEGTFTHLDGDQNGEVITIEYGWGDIADEPFDNGAKWVPTKDGKYMAVYSIYEATIENTDGFYTLTSFVRKEIL